MKRAETSHKELINIVYDQIKDKTNSNIEMLLIITQPLPILKEMNEILEKNPTISIQKLLDSVDWVETREH